MRDLNRDHYKIDLGHIKLFYSYGGHHPAVAMFPDEHCYMTGPRNGTL
jgi:hypothetical protein